MKTVEFFFDFGSPYSYVASTQVEGVVARANARMVWRPFLLGAVFKASGNVSPASNLYKARYMLKDLLDWTRHYRLPDFTLPDPFPAHSLLACRLALVADESQRLPPFAHALYRRIFAQGQDQADRKILSEVLGSLGLDAAACLSRAESLEIKERLRQNTDEAVRRGAFGAPTFFIGEDMYVGNDRLMMVEKALRDVRQPSTGD